MVIEVDQDRAGQHNARAGARTEDGRHDADGARHPFGREFVADDPEGEGEHGPACALDNAADQHHGKGCGQRADQRPDGEGDQDGDDDPLLADHVTDSAQDRRGDGGTEQVRGQQPTRPALRRVQRVLQLRNGRDDQALQQAEGQGGGGEDRKGDDVVGACACHGGSTPRRNGRFRLC